MKTEELIIIIALSHRIGIEEYVTFEEEIPEEDTNDTVTTLRGV